MSTGWQGASLLEPLSVEQPCGKDLEASDLALLNSFDGFRLYGRTRSLEPAPPSADGRKIAEAEEKPPEWGELKEQSLGALRLSKDLRVLAPLAAALLRTDGLAAFAQAVRVASQWLDAYWEQTYPLIDGDGFARRSALNCLADPFAVIERLRRVAVVTSRQHGVLTLRDIDLASEQPMPARVEREAQIAAAFADQPLEELIGLTEDVSGAVAALKNIEQRMRIEVGAEATPDFAPLTTQLVKIERVLRAQLALRDGGAGTARGEQEVVGAAQPAAGFGGSIRSREEAIRALEAVAEFFRTHEPSSPVPLFCDRARSLVSRGFLEVLADIAPDAVKQARAAGGLKD